MRFGLGHDLYGDHESSARCRREFSSLERVEGANTLPGGSAFEPAYHLSITKEFPNFIFAREVEP